MKLSGAAAERFLKKPDDGVVAVLLFGPDNGLVRERAQDLAKLWGGASDDPFAVATLTESDLKSDPAKLADEAAAMSLTGGARLVRVRLTTEAGAGSVSDLIADADKGSAQIEAKIIVEAGDLTPRSKIRKAFEAAKTSAAIGCYSDSAADALGLAETALQQEGLSLSRDAREPLSRALSQDRGLARQEIEKLILYKGLKDTRPDGEDEVTAADIAATLGAMQDSSMDDIIESAALGDARSADAALRRALAAGGSPVGVIRAASRHISRLHQARAIMDGGRSAGDAMKALRPPVFFMRQGAFGQALNNWRSDALERAAQAVYAAEKQAKTSGLPDEAVAGELVLAIAKLARFRR